MLTLLCLVSGNIDHDAVRGNGLHAYVEDRRNIPDKILKRNVSLSTLKLGIGTYVTLVHRYISRFHFSVLPPTSSPASLPPPTFFSAPQTFLRSSEICGTLTLRRGRLPGELSSAWRSCSSIWQWRQFERRGSDIVLRIRLNPVGKSRSLAVVKLSLVCVCFPFLRFFVQCIILCGTHRRAHFLGSSVRHPLYVRNVIPCGTSLFFGILRLRTWYKYACTP